MKTNTRHIPPVRHANVLTDVAQRILVNAGAALDDIRCGEDFPDHIYEQIARDIMQLRARAKIAVVS